MKKLLSLLLAISLLLVPALASADGGGYVRSDDPAVLDAAAVDALNARAAELLTRANTLAMILYTPNELTGDALADATKDFYAESAYTEIEHAVILGVSPADVYIGATKDTLTDAQFDLLLGKIDPKAGDLKAQLLGYLDALEGCVKADAPENAGLSAALTAGLPQSGALLTDETGLLTADEQATLLALLTRISTEQNCDVAVVIPRSLGYKSASDYADDFYDESGLGRGDTKDGILLLVCMEERDWATSTAGAAQDWFDDSKLYTIEDAFRPYLSNGQYLKAFTTFAEGCERVLKAADRREVLYLKDDADMLTEAERASAIRILESHSHVGMLCDIVVLTASDLAGKTAAEYVSETFQTNAYRHSIYDDKVVLVIDRASAKCYVVTGGGAAKYLDENETALLEAAAAEKLSAGDALGTVRGFAEGAYSRIRAYYEAQFSGAPVRQFQLFSFGRLWFALIAGFLIGLIVASSMKKKLTSVQKQTAAASYLVKDTMRLTDSNDLYLYSNVSKTVRASESSRSGGGHSGGSHFSSGGFSHGGHSGKF